MNSKIWQVQRVNFYGSVLYTVIWVLGWRRDAWLLKDNILQLGVEHYCSDGILLELSTWILPGGFLDEYKKGLDSSVIFFGKVKEGNLFFVIFSLYSFFSLKGTKRMPNNTKSTSYCHIVTYPYVQIN